MSWPTVALGEIASFRNGLNYTKANWGEGLTVIGVADFKDRVCPDYSILGQINPDGVANEDDLLEHGDILFVRSNGNRDLIGRNMYIDRPPFPVAYAGFCIRARLNPGAGNSRFYAYLLRSGIVRRTLSAQGGRANIASLNQGILKRLVVPRPPVAVQRRIADILSAYDDLIENNNRRMALLEESIHLLYREWFVYLRFPGHERVKVVDGVPEGWCRRPLRDFVSTQYGFTASAQDDAVGPQFVRGMDINKRPWIDWDSVPYCEVPDDQEDKFRVNVGDVLMIRMADPGKVGIIEQEVDAVFASYLVRLSVADDSVLPYSLFYFLRSAEYQGFITGASTGATRKSASAKLMTTPSMLVPALSVQEEFEAVARETRGQLNILLKQNRKLREARDLLLPRLMDGRIPI